MRRKKFKEEITCLEISVDLRPEVSNILLTSGRHIMIDLSNSLVIQITGSHIVELKHGGR